MFSNQGMPIVSVLVLPFTDNDELLTNCHQHPLNGHAYSRLCVFVCLSWWESISMEFLVWDRVMKGTVPESPENGLCSINIIVASHLVPQKLSTTAAEKAFTPLYFIVSI